MRVSVFIPTARRCVLLIHFVLAMVLGLLILRAGGYSYWNLPWFFAVAYVAPPLAGFVLAELETGFRIDLDDVEWKFVLLWPFVFWSEFS
jgi:hypothetical protein